MILLLMSALLVLLATAAAADGSLAVDNQALRLGLAIVVGASHAVGVVLLGLLLLLRQRWIRLVVIGECVAAIVLSVAGVFVSGGVTAATVVGFIVSVVVLVMLSAKKVAAWTR